ncbi:MAG: hypothetical protein HKO57_01060, partial [Akkermansiaceae bacterium]|nr:hypothetical protein [Akkermansiaceae bacterium]
MNSFRDLSVRRPLCKGADLRRPGFSLIVTISILVLLALVAVGLLTLSTITVRSASLTSAQAEARANARLALMLAIGELQKQVGADQRITANAAILDDQPDSPEVQGVNHPHWTGVWKSWAAGSQQFGNDSLSTHQTIARPNARQIGMAPSYEENRFDHFVDWLVSLPRPVPQDLQQRLDRARSFPLDAQLSPGDGATGVRLVGRNTIGTDDPAMFVGAALLDVDTDSRPNTERNGRYAWWVADESTKARVLGDQYELQETLANSDLIDQALSAGSPEASAIEGLDTLRDNPADLQRAVSRDSLDLLAADPSTVGRAFHSATPFSLGVMTDVREGGLKRDLNSLLERPINIDDDRDDWMLYRFGRDDDRVPIQDLSAFYQTYREVVQFDGRAARNRYAGRSMQVNNINFGGGFGFTRDYTNLYRMPFPVKYQFLLSYIGVPRDRNKIKAPNTDRYKLHVGVTPAVTFWNPYNVPLVLNTGAEQATQMRMFNIPFGIEWQKKSAKGPFNSPKPNSLVWLTNRLMEGSGNSADDGFGGSDRDNGITLYLGGDKNHVIFQPGEVRTFSLRQTGTRTGYEGILNSNRYRPELEADPGWDPSFFLVMPRSERDNDTKHVEKEFPGGSGSKKDGGALTFNPNDEIGITIHAASTLDMANGAAFHIFHRQSSTMYPGLDDNIDRSHMRRQYQFTSRLHSEQQKAKDNGFNKALMQQAFPEGSDRIVLDPVRGNELIGGDHRPFMLVSLTAGCEISQATAGDFRGRRFVSRPFLHSTPAQSAVFVDREDKDSFYHHGWNWWVQDINSVLEASVQVAPNNRSGYWGGGYTPEFGSTNVVQQEIPLTPVHSIAALS